MQISKQFVGKEALESIMRNAGRLLLSWYGRPLKRIVKQDESFYTEADIAVENYLKTELKQVNPTAEFIAEESGITGHNAYAWVIDPIDGTTNFTAGLPYFCISVALTYNNMPQWGAIYYPLLDRFFYAEKGRGAVVNDSPIQVTHVTNIAHALIAVGIPYRHKERSSIINIAQQVAQHVYGIRHYGSIALDLAYTAAGHFDGVIFNKLSWWDVAAGIVIIEEAGGVITDFQGNALVPGYTSCIAGGASLVKLLRPIIAI